MPDAFWNKLFWVDEKKKIELFNHNYRYIWREMGESFEEKNTFQVRGWLYYALEICSSQWHRKYCLDGRENGFK